MKKNLKSLSVVLSVKVRFEREFEVMGRLTVTDVRRERIPLLWSTVRERALQTPSTGMNYDILLFILGVSCRMARLRV